MYQIYILLCSDNLFYTGFTNDLKRRINQHKNGEVQYTKNKRPIKLVYKEKCKTKETAMQREKQIKGWSKQKKINLIKFGHPTKS